MNPSRSRRAPLAAMCAAAVALTLAVSGGAKVAAASASGGPTVGTSDGAVRGVGVPGGYAFRGLPYAAPPTGNLRWRAPQPPASWSGDSRRDAVRTQLPAEAEPVRAAGPPVRGLPVPECLHADVAP